ncbi:MAG: AAA family ATPase [Deltaproteobacteria bacterium]|nr:AAA family ATPase [Deltaproteobacteria bacterium]
MDVLKEILSWSVNRPAWQRDALRRLVHSDSLDDNDLAEITELCKGAHGLSENQNTEPLNESHIPTDGNDTGTVNLLSISHYNGVNALAEDQTITFGSGLTVVYGDNAAGKSGYTRILKSACQARGAEDILGNVLSGTAPLTPSVSIRFTVGDDGEEQKWKDNTEDSDFLGRVSVFDSHSAAVYLNERTDVAFRPFGLDLFDKLSNTCEEVRKRLERECRVLESAKIPIPELPEGTMAYKLVSSLSSLTKPEAVTELSTLTDAENEKMLFLEKRLRDIQSENPEKTAEILKLRARRLELLFNRLVEIDRSLGSDALKAVFCAQKTARLKQVEASKLRDATFPSNLVNGTGSDVWGDMWEAAMQFSTEKAYMDKPFPFIETDAQCVLCQQNLDSNAVARLIKFQEFVTSQSEQDLKQAKEKFANLYENLKSLNVVNDFTKDAVKELCIETDALATILEKSLEEAANRHFRAIKALQEYQEFPSDLPSYSPQKDKIQALVKELNQRASELVKKFNKEEIEKITRELQEFKARKILGKYKSLIIGEIDRKARLAAYELCLRDTRTTMITKKSTEVTKEVVTKQLKRSFNDELENFNFTHVEVELQEAGGERGALYHKLILKRAPGIELPKVVSEGEARCLSIAAFFAELSTADDPSTILFDDPVSSLDHKWRASVARRLVKEAKARQVIVFTHDIVFLLALHRYAEERGVVLSDQHLRRERLGAGVCDEELPWAAMKVKKRIGVLKNNWQIADKQHRNGKQKEYEHNAIFIYGQLRETWERAFEEVLLDGMVERYRENIQTQQVRKLSDITEQDCEQLEAGITKCSKWLPGHDQAPAENEDIPEPNDLKTDIDVLEQWVNKIKRRRR